MSIATPQGRRRTDGRTSGDVVHSASVGSRQWQHHTHTDGIGRPVSGHSCAQCRYHHQQRQQPMELGPAVAGCRLSPRHRVVPTCDCRFTAAATGSPSRRTAGTGSTRGVWHHNARALGEVRRRLTSRKHPKTDSFVRFGTADRHNSPTLTRTRPQDTRECSEPPAAGKAQPMQR